MMTMKNLILFSIIIFSFTACDGFFLFQKMITIKGKVSTASKAKGNFVKSSGILTLADANKVLIYYGNKYALANLSNGSFSVQAPAGSATCLVFLDSNNQFIGNLFAGGLNVLPLVGLGNTSSIDLSTLTLEGTRIIPANDPIGSTIQISAQEISFMQQVGAYYQTLSKNLDMDNDGSPDIINGDQLRVNSVVNMFAGSFGVDLKAPVMLSPENFVVNYGLRIAGAIAMYDINQTVSLTNQSTQKQIPLSWDPIKADPSQLNKINEFILVFQQNIQQQNQSQPNTLPFADGVYSLQLTKDRQFTFNFSNINMQNYMMIIKPTIHSDNNGNITKISFEFVFPDGKPANPHNLIQGYIRSQINDNNYNQLYEGHHLYGTFTADDNYDYYNETISKKIAVSQVNQCNFAYIDILGNEYEFSWRRN